VGTAKLTAELAASAAVMCSVIETQQTKVKDMIMSCPFGQNRVLASPTRVRESSSPRGRFSCGWQTPSTIDSPSLPPSPMHKYL